MKDKITKKHITAFDRRARKLGIIGGITFTLALAFGIPMLSHFNTQNELMMAQIQQDVKTVDNLQFQLEEGAEIVIE